MNYGAIANFWLGTELPDTSTNKRVPYTGERLSRHAYVNLVLDEMQGE